ncbi:MAG: S1C family serine protease [Actinomycetota bacterium]
MERGARPKLASYVVAFVLGFTSCALAARLLLPVQVGAASVSRFNQLDPAEVAAAVSDSVVTIETYPSAATEASWPPWPFRHSTAEIEPTSVASGVLLSSDGHIVTNAHVLDGASRLRVRLADDREFDARIVGVDKHADLAVLKAPVKHLHPAEVGDSRRVRAGEAVVAIGNPLGFERSVSVGVVSANRTGPLRVDGSVLGDMIQTDAAINQGNSGGGLFTADGKLVGINTAIMVTQGSSGSIGIGFAIPTHRMRPVVQALITFGRVPRPWLGIRYERPTGQTLIRQVRHGAGVRVEDVMPNSPAALAGLQPEDLVQRIGECPIRCADDIYSVVERYRPGAKVDARVVRDGEVMNVRLKLGAPP